MIDEKLHAEIRRLFFAEHFRVNTIAETLGVHHSTVRRAIEAERFTVVPRPVRPTLLDPYTDFIEKTLEQYPRLTATRIYEMVKGRGYKGSVVQLRRYVRTVRPRPKEAFLRLSALPGEQGQVDWGNFGKLTVGSARRSLSCFVLVLSHSRAMAARFFFDQTLESFLSGHVSAFEALGGVPRELLYDNLKTAVLERRGDHIQFHPALLELCGHYHFAPKPCSPYRGNEKGKVERTIQYLRRAFFAARHFDDIDDLNRQLTEWIDRVAHQRARPGDAEKNLVTDALDEERKYLLSLPAHRFACESLHGVKVGKTPYVRFDLNDYSVPHTAVCSTLTLSSSPERICISDEKGKVIAEHTRCYDRGRRIENPEHLQALTEHKKKARSLRMRDELEQMSPLMPELLCLIVERNLPLGSEVQRLHRLALRYGQPKLCQAVSEALSKHAPSAASVGHILEQMARRESAPPAVEVILPADERVRSLVVRPHNLSDYDTLGKAEDDDEA